MKAIVGSEGGISRCVGRRVGPVRLRVSAVVLVLGLIVGACDSPVAPGVVSGYDFWLDLEGPVVYRWAVGESIDVYIDGGPDASRADLLHEAFTLAAEDWNLVLAPWRVRFVAVDRVVDADVVVRWSDVPAPVDTSECEPRVEGRAATTFCPVAGAGVLEPFPLGPPYEGEASRVRMVVTILAEEATGEERVRQLVAHELGHVLGIGRHSPSPDDLMWEGALVRIAPSEGDRATVRRLYETPAEIVL